MIILIVTVAWAGLSYLINTCSVYFGSQKWYRLSLCPLIFLVVINVIHCHLLDHKDSLLISSAVAGVTCLLFVFPTQFLPTIVGSAISVAVPATAVMFVSVDSIASETWVAITVSVAVVLTACVTSVCAKRRSGDAADTTWTQAAFVTASFADSAASAFVFVEGGRELRNSYGDDNRPTELCNLQRITDQLTVVLIVCLAVVRWLFAWYLFRRKQQVDYQPV